MLSAPLSVSLFLLCEEMYSKVRRSSVVLGIRFCSAQKLLDIYLMRITEELYKLELLGTSFPEFLNWEAMGI